MSSKRKIVNGMQYVLGVVVLMMPFVATLPRVVYATGAIEISDCQELQAINDDLTASYVLTQDIDCATDSGTATYTEDFETETVADWTADGDGSTWNDWTETCATEILPDPIVFDSTVMGTYGNAGNDCLRENDEESYLMSPVVSLPEDDVVSLQFDSYATDEGGYCTEAEDEDYDEKTVAVTTDEGDTYTILNNCTRLHPFMEDGLDTREWRFSLDDFAGEDVQFMFMYDTGDDCCDEELGWFIDNVTVLEGGDAPLVTIGNDDNLFTGTFDGQGYKVTNFNISQSQLGVGLFGEISEEALVKNVTVADSVISNPDEGTGGVVGINLGTVRNVYTQDVTILGGDDSSGAVIGENEGVLLGAGAAGGSVTGQDGAGGIAGYNGESATITYVESSTSVFGEDNAGGLVGENDGAISNAQASGDVEPRFINGESFGGLVGYSQGSISKSFATGNVTAQETVGGLVGANDGQIEEAYSRGTVTGEDAIGGLVGYSGSESTITNVFTVSPVSIGEDSSETGGLVGNLDGGALAGAYYDMDRTLTYCTLDGQDPDPEGCIGVNGEGSQPNYFKYNNTNAPLDEWDFDEAWLLVEDDYPLLSFVDDTDNDGVANETEDAAPNDGDANNDGAPDSDQANVASLEDEVSNGYAALEAPAECSIEAMSIAAESVNTSADTGFDYPAGLMNFTLDCGTPGFEATVTQYYYGVNASGLVVRKYNSVNDSYQAVSGAVVSAITIGGDSVTKAVYSITDGEELDEDDTANGTIVDPSGVASSAVNAPNTGFGRL